MQTLHYSIKWTGFLVPQVPRLFKIHSIMRLPLTQDYPALLIALPAGHYNSTGTIVLASS